jgi:hypothetical protein
MSGKVRERAGRCGKSWDAPKRSSARHARCSRGEHSGPRRQRARRARPCRLDALQLRLALLPSLPPWHGDVQGSPSSRTRRARAAVPELSASSRSEPAEVGRGKWPFGPFNITRGCAKLRCSLAGSLGSATATLRSAPFGFAQPALCLAPRPPSALCRVLLAHCTAEVRAFVCRHTNAPLESGARARRERRSTSPPPARACASAHAPPPPGAPF